MPAKAPVDENVRFLYSCLIRSDYHYIDFHLVAADFGINPAAARMRWSRLRKNIALSSGFKNDPNHPHHEQPKKRKHDGSGGGASKRKGKFLIKDEDDDELRALGDGDMWGVKRELKLEAEEEEEDPMAALMDPMLFATDATMQASEDNPLPPPPQPAVGMVGDITDSILHGASTTTASVVEEFPSVEAVGRGEANTTEDHAGTITTTTTITQGTPHRSVGFTALPATATPHGNDELLELPDTTGWGNIVIVKPHVHSPNPAIGASGVKESMGLDPVVNTGGGRDACPIEGETKERRLLRSTHKSGKQKVVLVRGEASSVEQQYKEGEEGEEEEEEGEEEEEEYEDSGSDEEWVE